MVTQKVDYQMIKVKIKPISVNACWKGRRFKTPAYVKFEKVTLMLLPKMIIPKGRLGINFIFGFSNDSADWDNPIKPIQDILQKKYLFNDKDIHEATVKKTKVKKGEEYFEFEIYSIK